MKDEVEYLLDSKLSIEDASALIESKVSFDQFQNELDRVFARMEETVDHIRRMRVKAETDIANLSTQLQEKVGVEDLNSLLETKANKQSVVAAL